MTGYVCREHLEPVNSRGAGCPDCDAELRLTPAERRARRVESWTDHHADDLDGRLQR